MKPIQPTQTLDSLINSWASLSPVKRKLAFSVLPRSESERLFQGLSAVDQSDLIQDLTRSDQQRLLKNLAPDNCVDLIQQFAPELRNQWLELLDETNRQEVNALLAYVEDHAGGLMNSRYIRLRPTMRVDEAISYLRAQSQQPSRIESIYYAYVLDNEQHLMGVVSFRDLIMANPSKRVEEIMTRDGLVTVPEEMDQEEVSRLFAQKNLLVVPVVDRQNHMKGIITVDDIVDVVEDEATEDIQKLGGTEALDAPYLKLGLAEMFRKRAGWLSILFVGEMFTATAMAYFEHEISRAVVLALFIPLIISSGGNAGSQASTLVIRAIALREVKLADWWRILLREIPVGLFLGLTLGGLGLLRIALWPNRSSIYGEHYLLIAATVGLGVVGVVLWGSLVGAMLPLLLRRFGLDPATASTPFVATLVDVTGLIIYFSVASLTLHGTLL